MHTWRRRVACVATSRRDSCLAVGAAHYTARRGVRDAYSPDRTHNETIADRQNAFDWTSVHLYRPHQHFTYDPTCWSRPLLAAATQERRLDVLERLRCAAERAAEQQQQQTSSTTGSSKGGGDDDTMSALPVYFYDAIPPQVQQEVQQEQQQQQQQQQQQGVFAHLTLQELLALTRAARQRLTLPRYTRTPRLRARERVYRSYLDLLLHVHDAVVCDLSSSPYTATRTTSQQQQQQQLQGDDDDGCATLTRALDAWHILLDGLTELVTALQARSNDNDNDNGKHATVDDEAAMPPLLLRTLYVQLCRTCLAPLQRHVQQQQQQQQRQQEGRVRVLSVEALAQALYVTTHPFVLRSAATQADDASSSSLSHTPLSRASVLACAERVLVLLDAQLHARMTQRDGRSDDDAVDDSRRQPHSVWLDTAHVAVLLRAVQRYTRHSARARVDSTATSAAVVTLPPPPHRVLMLARLVQRCARHVLHLLRSSIQPSHDTTPQQPVHRASPLQQQQRRRLLLLQQQQRQHVQTPLRPFQRTRNAPNDHSSDADAASSQPHRARTRAIVLDEVTRPNSVVTPATRDDDIACLTDACATLLSLAPLHNDDDNDDVVAACATTTMTTAVAHALRRAVYDVLRALSYAPTYDLDAARASALACALLERGSFARWTRACADAAITAATSTTAARASGGGSHSHALVAAQLSRRADAEQALRLLLLLARLDYHAALGNDTDAMATTTTTTTMQPAVAQGSAVTTTLLRLLLCLCCVADPPPRPLSSSRQRDTHDGDDGDVREPDSDDDDDDVRAAHARVAEWRRLRGQATHALLHALSPSERVLSQHAPAVLQQLRRQQPCARRHTACTSSTSTRSTTARWASLPAALAFGAFGGHLLLPLSWWHALCQDVFGLSDLTATTLALCAATTTTTATTTDARDAAWRDGGRVDATTAAALVLLRARHYATASQARVVALDTRTITYLACCIECITHAAVTLRQLHDDVDAWDVAYPAVVEQLRLHSGDNNDDNDDDDDDDSTCARCVRALFDDAKQVVHDTHTRCVAADATAPTPRVYTFS